MDNNGARRISWRTFWLGLILFAAQAAAGARGALAQTASPSTTGTATSTTPGTTTTTGSGPVITLGHTGEVLFIVLIIGLFVAVLFGLILYDRITVNRRLDKMLPDVRADIRPRSQGPELTVDNIRALVRAVSSPGGSQGLTRTLLALGLLSLVGFALVALLVGNGSNVSDPLKALLTALAAAFTTVLGFYFGAKTASDATEAATAAAARGPGTVVTVPDPPTGVER